LSPDLLRCRCKLIGRDTNIDNEGSKHNIEILQSLHHDSVVRTQFDLSNKANPCKRNQEHK
jgi:hypothetical protein